MVTVLSEASARSSRTAFSEKGQYFINNRAAMTRMVAQMMPPISSFRKRADVRLRLVVRVDGRDSTRIEDDINLGLLFRTKCWTSRELILRRRFYRLFLIAFSITRCREVIWNAMIEGESSETRSSAVYLRAYLPSRPLVPLV